MVDKWRARRQRGCRQRCQQGCRQRCQRGWRQRDCGSRCRRERGAIAASSECGAVVMLPTTDDTR